MGKSYCTYCQFSTNGAKVQCSVCPEIELCLLCFSSGAELGNHKRDHAYTVIDHQQFDIFEKPVEWTANEELMLLDAIEQYGFGNWEDISGHVETKDREQCINHYNKLFIQGNIGRCTFPTELRCDVTDHSTVNNGGLLSPSLSSPVPAPELAQQEQRELGYMPLRDDYEREFNNAAEANISGLNINIEDDDLDIAFKTAQVDMYRHQVMQRFQFRKMARDHDIQSSVFTKPKQNVKGQKKKLSREDRELQESLKAFAQFQTGAEREKFLEGLKKQKQLRQQIKDYMRYRRNGVTKLDECTHYDEDKYLREKKKEHRKKMLTAPPTKRTSMVSRKAEENSDHTSSSREDAQGPSEDAECNGSPGYDLLTDTEKRLCNSIGLKPSFYITIKTCILKDYLQRRQGVPVKVRYPMGMEKSHRLKIVNFLRDSGWIGVS